MCTVAMAYCGSGNNKAIRRLLHVAVSDVNDDVRRAAVESLAFVLFRTPEQCPSVVSLLSESYNPHVRYGAATALGICCAGTGDKEAINLLEPMTNDPVNYVRQGALIASALIVIQQTEITCPKVNQFRQLYSRVINDSMMMLWPSLALFWPRAYWTQVDIMSRSPCSPELDTSICLLWLASLSLPSSGSGFLFHTSCHWLIPLPVTLA